MYRMITTIVASMAFVYMAHAVEYHCTKCMGPLLRTDTYCQKCGAKIVSWPDTTPVYSYDSTKSDMVTPIKISFLHTAAIPWDASCTVYGLHVSVLGGKCHTVCGFNVAGIGSECHTLDGLSAGLFNQAYDTYGIQMGFFNCAENLKGLQIGAFNIAGSKNTCGVQIGIINQMGMGEGSWYIPGINVCF